MVGGRLLVLLDTIMTSHAYGEAEPVGGVHFKFEVSCRSSYVAPGPLGPPLRSSFIALKPLALALESRQDR